MAIYWTLQVPDLPTEVGYGPKAEFMEWLGRRDLDGVAPADWIIDVMSTTAPDGTSVYVHGPQGEPIWTLTWEQPNQAPMTIESERFNIAVICGSSIDGAGNATMQECAKILMDMMNPDEDGLEPWIGYLMFIKGLGEVELHNGVTVDFEDA